MMIVAAARELAGQRVCFVGVGLPNIAVNLAKRTVAPDLELVYEAGVFGARPARLPLSIGDPTIVTGATAVVSMFELFAFYLQRGLIDVGFLGAAQIDRFGNLNTTVIGDYDAPKTRLPGSGGACEIAINARNVFVIMRQSSRSFVDKIDFRTSPGNLGGAEQAERIRTAGGWHGRGPSVVVTDLGIWHFDDDGEMRLDFLHPGATLDEVRATIAWEPRISTDLADDAGADGGGAAPRPRGAGPRRRLHEVAGAPHQRRAAVRWREPLVEDRVLRADHQHRARGVPDHVLRHAAEEQAADRAAAVTADHDHVGVLRLGGRDDHVARVARPDEERDGRRPPRDPRSTSAWAACSRFSRTWSIRARNLPPGRSSDPGSITDTTSSDAPSRAASSNASSVAAEEASLRSVASSSFSMSPAATADDAADGPATGPAAGSRLDCAAIAVTSVRRPRRAGRR